MDGQPLSGPYMDSFIASLCCCSTFPFSSQTLSSANTDSFNFLFSLSKVTSKFVWNRDLEMREARSSQKIYWSGEQIELEEEKCVNKNSSVERIKPWCYEGIGWDRMGIS